MHQRTPQFWIFKSAVCAAILLFLTISVEARSVQVSIPAHSVSHIAFYIAQENGYYRDEGLEVQLILMAAPVAIRALIGGDVDISTVGGSGIPPIIRGASMDFLFTSFVRPIHWFYSKTNITDVSELKGKKVAIDGLGGVIDSLLREVLKKQNLETGRDVTVLAAGVQSTRFAALSSGSIDATILTFPWNFLAAEKGFRELVNFTKQDIVQFTGCVVVRRAWLQSDPVLAERFMRATMKGLLYALDNRPGSTAVLARNLKVKPDMAAKIYDSARPAMALGGTVSEASQKRVIEDVVSLMGQKEFPPPDRVFNFSLARKVRAQLETAGWQP
jgi:NitT/TauT family transport system substrate-binding protein